MGNNSPSVDVSVIIVNYNTRGFLHEALQSVCSSPVSKEVIVVDNNSTDGSIEMIERSFPSVRIIRNPVNERFAKPNNDAMRIACGRYYLLLNSDASLEPNALERLIAYMDQHPEVGMCGPQLLNPDGAIQRSCRGFVSPWTQVCDMLVLDRLFPNSPLFARAEFTYFDHTSEREVDHVMAAVVLIRAEVIREIGMFDEALSIYYNDLDLSLRARQAGWKTVFYPAAKAVHHSGKTALPLIRQSKMFREQYENIFYYFRKHFGKSSVTFFKLMLLIGFLPRTIYWYLRSTFDQSEQTLARRQFAIQSLGIALPFSRSKIELVL